MIGKKISGTGTLLTTLDGTELLEIEQDDGTSAHAATQTLVDLANLQANIFNRSLYQGLTVARVTATTFSVSAGAVGDSTFVDSIYNTAPITKSLSLFAAGTGNGALDQGTVANNTWYAVFEIKDVTNNLVDTLLSTSRTNPLLPTGYTLFRRVFDILTNGSAQIVDFDHINGKCMLKAKVVEINVVTPASTNRIARTVTTPLSVLGLFVARLLNTSTSCFLDIGHTASTDAAASVTNSKLNAGTPAAGSGFAMGEFEIPVDTSRQIYTRNDTTSNTFNSLFTLGWINNIDV